MDADDLVDTTEMYLKAVLELEEEGVVALRARLAERFDHSGPTVQDTVARMQRHELLHVESDRHLRLTARGRRTARSVMRKHRLAEVFLDRVIGLDWTQIHQEACQWEHVMSDRVEQLLDELLGHPTVSPYGNPFDPADAPADTANLVRLAAAGEAVQGTLRWVGEPLQVEPAALSRLRELGILPGAELSWSRHGPAILVSVAGGAAEAELPAATGAHLFAVTTGPASGAARDGGA